MFRRKFIQNTSLLTAGAILSKPLLSSPQHFRSAPKKRVAMVGTGVRAIGMWGRPVLNEFSDTVEFVGLCDINPGRVLTAKKMIGVNCETFTDFDEMMKKTKPDLLLVMSVDGIHHEHIIKGLQYGADIITEKPMTIDEEKCQSILNAEKQTGKKVTVTFNYRYSPHRLKIYEILRSGVIGKITSADFHWYLDVYHGADYFRRWHRLRDKSGSLLVHKSTHHFDLLNWWLNSEPSEVFAYGSLEHYGSNNPFRHTHCRPCPHKSECAYYYDITKNKFNMDLYVANEGHDGYHRDGCVWRNDTDIFDKMAVQIKYADNTSVSYSLTTYSPYEGYRIAFNGTKGRVEAWIKERQPWEEPAFDEIQVTGNFGKKEIIHIPNNEAGHGGGDPRLRMQAFNPENKDVHHQAAGSRDGAMSILTGIAARKSIDSGQPVRIDSLTDLRPRKTRIEGI